MASASWSATGGGGCQVDWVDEVAIAIEETVSTQQAFRKVVQPGTFNTIGFNVTPGILSPDMPIGTQKIYCIYVEGSFLDLTSPTILTPQRFSLVVSVNDSGYVELMEGALQLHNDKVSIVSTIGGLATCLLQSDPTNKRIYSWFARVEPLTTTSSDTQIV
jgi:hypothetical protein